MRDQKEKHTKKLRQKEYEKWILEDKERKKKRPLIITIVQNCLLLSQEKKETWFTQTMHNLYRHWTPGSLPV